MFVSFNSNDSIVWKTEIESVSHVLQTCVITISTISTWSKSLVYYNTPSKSKGIYMNNKKQKILELRSQNKSYKEIADIIGCSKQTVAYYVKPGYKEKIQQRTKKYRLSQHPYQKKLETFKYQKMKNKLCKNQTCKAIKLIRCKIKTFFRNRKTKMEEKPTFTVKDIINKFGENPRCYITGQPIDIYKPRTYNFDHIIPVSRNGKNTLENLGICTKTANESKTDMTYEEFVQFCQKVVDYYNNK